MGKLVLARVTEEVGMGEKQVRIQKDHMGKPCDDGIVFWLFQMNVNTLVVYCTMVLQPVTTGWHQVKGLWDFSVLFFKTVKKNPTIISKLIFNFKKLLLGESWQILNRQAGDWKKIIAKTSNNDLYPNM